MVGKTICSWIFLIMLACVGFAQNSPVVVRAVNGVIDLRNADFSQKSHSLRGSWNFYPDLLLTDSELADHQPRQVLYPALWTRDNGPKNGATGVGTYSVTILLPKESPKLAFRVPDAYSAYQLFANGALISANGLPASKKEDSRPFWETKTVNLNNSDTIRLVLQMANYWHYKGGPYKDITLGERREMYLDRNRSHALDLLLAGCLFMGGLFFLGLFIFGTQDKPILYFSLFCIVYSYRMIGTSDYVLHGIMPELPWAVTLHIEYLTLVIGVGLFGRYTLLLYPEHASKFVMNFLLILCGVYSIVILLAPPVIFTMLLRYFLIVMFLYIGYAFHTYVQAMRHNRVGSGYALVSSGVLLLIFLLINLQYFNFVIPVKGVTFTLYVSFFFLQSLVLSHRFSVRLKDAASLAKEGLRTKSEFLSTMSHEIRTPLNSVIGMAHLLQRSNTRNDQNENFEVLLFSANNLLSIVNNILDYNKIEAGKIHFEQINMDLPAIAKNILAGLKTLADEKRIDLKLDVDPGITHYVTGDPTRTAQVLNNLVHNGLKFTREGSVSLSVTIEEKSGENISLRFCVTDTGIGIAPDKQQLVFERFTQADSSTSRRYGGTGLGLSISQKILNLQGTGLVINSEPGKGSSFSFSQQFRLTPELLPSQPGETLKVIANEKPLEGIDILLVEDNPMNVLVAQTFLERSGAAIDVAVNGQEALDKFDPLRHRLILMDLDMPVMDGYEATRTLRQQGQTVPIVALTASLPTEVQQEVLEAGLSDIMVKPFNPDELHRVIMMHLQ